MARMPTMHAVSSQTLQMMQADQLAAQLAADAEAAATASIHAVLLSPDLFPELFQFLDRGSKAALRCASRAVCSQVDGSIETVASPASGFSDISLSATLVKFPRVHNLTLLRVGSTSDLAPLATTSLAGLKSLTVRQVGPMQLRSRPQHACPTRNGVVGHRSLARGPRVGSVRTI
jgi:hypothetical protein